MFSRLPPYQESAPTSIAWAPQLPAHWEVARGKSLFTKVEREPRPEDGVVTCFRDGVVTLRSRRRTTGFTESLKEIGYQGIRKGDLVIHAMDAFAGAAGVSDSDGKGTPVYSVCVPRQDANPHYYAAVVREMARSSWIQALSRGIRERSTDFRFDMFATQLLPLPPVDEQAAIVKYLGHATARIDKAIAAKQRLISLLEEQRRALVEDMVLGADRPDSERRDSGVPWLGAVPRTWQVLPARHVFRVVNRAPSGREVKLSVTQARGLVRTTDMVERSTQAQNFDRFQACLPGDLVLNKYKAHLGVFWGVPEPGLITPNYTVFRSARPLVTEYFEMLFRTSKYLAALRATVYGVTEGMSPLYAKDFYRIPLVFPSVEEQLRIVSSVQERTAKGASVIRKTQREIELLREFRMRLVSDVVLGQVDVRQVTEILPETSVEAVCTEVVTAPEVELLDGSDDLMEISEV